MQGIADILWRLAGTGDIRFWRETRGESPLPFLPTSPHELATLILEGRRLLEEFHRWREANRSQPSLVTVPPWNLHYTYSMTSQGLVRWENYACPDWSRFRGDFDGRLEEPGETVWSSTALTESFAREMLEVESLHIAHPASIHWETAHAEAIAPWEPIEGKFLPQGVKVSVKVTEVDGQAFQLGDPHRAAEQHKEHWRRCCDLCRP